LVTSVISLTGDVGLSTSVIGVLQVSVMTLLIHCNDNGMITIEDMLQINYTKKKQYITFSSNYTVSQKCQV